MQFGADSGLPEYPETAFEEAWPDRKRQVGIATSMGTHPTRTGYQTQTTFVILGNAPRTVGSVRSPFFFSTNLSILKEFGLSASHEQLKFELRLEAQNAFNHPVFGTPNTLVGDPSFGVISNTSVGPRECQLALKFLF